MLAYHFNSHSDHMRLEILFSIYYCCHFSIGNLETQKKSHTGGLRLELVLSGSLSGPALPHCHTWPLPPCHWVFTATILNVCTDFLSLFCFSPVWFQNQHNLLTFQLFFFLCDCWGRINSLRHLTDMPLVHRAFSWEEEAHSKRWWLNLSPKSLHPQGDSFLYY